MTTKVLIVDDSKLARMAIGKALKSLHPDWQHVEARNAEEAVAAVKETGADVALLDFNMPGRDGLALAAELKQSNPTMPIAIISANYQEEIIRRAQDLGAGFLAKPVTENGLAAFLSGAALSGKVPPT